MTIWPAISSDLDALVELAAAARLDQAVHQRLFWRPSADARDRHRPFLAGHIADDNVISLVAAERDTTGTAGLTATSQWWTAPIGCGP